MEYTQLQVARLLANYHAICGVLYGKSQSMTDIYPVETEDIPRKHADSVIDGKERARKKEELLCMIIDLDTGLDRCDSTVRKVIIEHFITEENVLTSKSRHYLRSCIRRLTNTINHGR